MNINFAPAPGCIVIIPQYESNEVAGMVIRDHQNLMPTGKVVCCGKLPYRFEKIKPGDIIAYQRGNYIEMSVKVDDIDTKVTVIYAPDFRGKFHFNEKTNHFRGLVAAFAVGAAIGWVSGQFITLRGLFKQWIGSNGAIQKLVQIISHRSGPRN